jgi:hypothetical protein
MSLSLRLLNHRSSRSRKVLRCSLARKRNDMRPGHLGIRFCNSKGELRWCWRGVYYCETSIVIKEKVENGVDTRARYKGPTGN